MKLHRLVPTEKETARLIEATTENGKSLDLLFGPREAWIEWKEDEPGPWTVQYVRYLRGELVIGTNGEGI